MSTTYILIDFENVQPQSLAVVADACFKVFVFLGPNQAVSSQFVDKFQGKHPDGEYVRLTQSGSQALDFLIAFHLGQLIANDPQGSFHIISKDKGFEPLIEHLGAKGFAVSRYQTIEEAVSGNAAKRTVTDRFAVAVGRLTRMKASRPRRLKTLSSTLKATFGADISDDEITEVIDQLRKRGFVEISKEKVTYPNPEKF